MTENKPIIIDELGCNNCPDKKRCDEQREHKDNIINSMLDDIKDTAIVYNCDLKDKIKNLKQNLPIITRCDVVLEKQLLRKTQECERKDKEIYELHIIIDRLLEASGYDKNTSTAEDFEDVYENMRYEQGLLDKLKAENEELRNNFNIEHAELLSARSKIEELKYQVEVFVRQLENANKEAIKEKEKNATERHKKEQAEQKLGRIREICKSYCELMCLCKTKETCESCINTEVLEIIDEVE